jgi:hypothetical protein
LSHAHSGKAGGQAGTSVRMDRRASAFREQGDQGNASGEILFLWAKEAAQPFPRSLSGAMVPVSRPCGTEYLRMGTL